LARDLTEPYKCRRLRTGRVGSGKLSALAAYAIPSRGAVTTAWPHDVAWRRADLGLAILPFSRVAPRPNVNRPRKSTGRRGRYCPFMQGSSAKVYIYCGLVALEVVLGMRCLLGVSDGRRSHARLPPQPMRSAGQSLYMSRNEITPLSPRRNAAGSAAPIDPTDRRVSAHVCSLTDDRPPTARTSLRDRGKASRRRLDLRITA
jgi:hypothetical protein